MALSAECGISQLSSCDTLVASCSAPLQSTALIKAQYQKTKEGNYDHLASKSDVFIVLIALFMYSFIVFAHLK